MSFNNLIAKAKNPGLSIKMGFIGLGKGGSEIAARLADTYSYEAHNRFPYEAVLVYSDLFLPDLPELRNPNIKQVELKSSMIVSAFDRESEKILFEQNELPIKRLMIEQLKSSELVWLTVDLSSVSGSVFGASLVSGIGKGTLKTLGFMIKLPPLTASKEILKHAIIFLKMIWERKADFAGTLYFPPYEEATELPGGLLHEVNVVPVTFTSSPGGRFKNCDLRALLSDPGNLHLVKVKISPSEIDTLHPYPYMAKIQRSVKEGMISSGYDFVRGDQVAICILAPRSTANRMYTFNFDIQLQEIIKDFNPISKINSIGYFLYDQSDEDDTVHIYVLMSGLELPDYISEMVEQYLKVQ
ncbi:hypothetical protein M4S82_15780 [Planococcus sp. MERTA32b]|nr:hypothetical protein [Planococcus sp. MER TA 32b]